MPSSLCSPWVSTSHHPQWRVAVSSAVAGRPAFPKTLLIGLYPKYRSCWTRFININSRFKDHFPSVFFRNTVDASYSWILYFQFAYSLKFVCDPELIVAALHGCSQTRPAEQWAMGVTTRIFPLSELGCAPPLHSAQGIQVSFCSWFSAAFNTFLCLLLAILLVRTASRCGAEVLWSLRKRAQRLGCALWRKKTCSISFVQTGVLVLLAVSSVVMNQQYELNRCL